MRGTSADVIIPSLKYAKMESIFGKFVHFYYFHRCSGDDISREKGYVAVEARTNVEIAELKREYLAMVDTSELPQPLFKLASNPILFGYKFLCMCFYAFFYSEIFVFILTSSVLAPGYFLQLRVKKHEDVGVLIAACDDAHYITTCSEGGKVLPRVVIYVCITCLFLLPDSSQINSSYAKYPKAIRAH